MAKSGFYEVLTFVGFGGIILYLQLKKCRLWRRIAVFDFFSERIFLYGQCDSYQGQRFQAENIRSFWSLILLFVNGKGLILNQESYRNLISGQDDSFGKRMLRKLLGVVSVIYASGIAIRNLCYDKRLLKSRTAKAPVISIGNVTTGGTGKTPLVVWLCRMLHKSDQKPRAGWRSDCPSRMFDCVFALLNLFDRHKYFVSPQERGCERSTFPFTARDTPEHKTRETPPLKIPVLSHIVSSHKSIGATSLWLSIPL